MHELDLVEAGSFQDAGKMLDGVLGEAVAYEEDPEISFSVQVGIRFILAGLNQISYIVEMPAGTGRIRSAKVCDLSGFRIKIVLIGPLLYLPTFPPATPPSHVVTELM